MMMFEGDDRSSIYFAVMLDVPAWRVFQFYGAFKIHSICHI